MIWYTRSIEKVVERAGINETETDFMWRQIDPELYYQAMRTTEGETMDRQE